MDQKSPEIQPANPERQQVIADIVSSDRQAFADWLQLHPDQPRLDLPDSAIRVLIPPRLYDFIEDPLQVKIRTIKSNIDSLDFYVVEEKNEYITNEESLWEYSHAVDNAVRAKQPIPPLPPDVDRNHYENRELLKDIVGMNDKILLTFSMTQLASGVLFVDSYGDRPELQGNGVGRNAYEGLRNFAKQIGNRYISGENREDVIHFFITKLGRVQLSTLTGQRKETLFDAHKLDLRDPEDNRFAECITVDFLDPNEKLQLLDGA